MNNLDDAPLLLLVGRLGTESVEEVFAQMHARYDARLAHSEWGPRYKLGPTFLYRGQKFTQVQTFAGSLVIRVVFDTRKGSFERPVIFRFDLADPFRMLSPDGTQVEVDNAELIRSED